MRAHPATWCSSRMNPAYPNVSWNAGQSRGRMCVCVSTRSGAAAGPPGPPGAPGAPAGAEGGAACGVSVAILKTKI